jgi:hypothetical protein
MYQGHHQYPQLKGQSATSTHGIPTFPLCAEQTHTGWLRPNTRGRNSTNRRSPPTAAERAPILPPAPGAPMTIHRSGRSLSVKAPHQGDDPRASNHSDPPPSSLQRHPASCTPGRLGPPMSSCGSGCSAWPRTPHPSHRHPDPRSAAGQRYPRIGSQRLIGPAEIVQLTNLQRLSQSPTTRPGYPRERSWSRRCGCLRACASPSPYRDGG